MPAPIGNRSTPPRGVNSRTGFGAREGAQPRAIPVAPCAHTPIGCFVFFGPVAGTVTRPEAETCSLFAVSDVDNPLQNLALEGPWMDSMRRIDTIGSATTEWPLS